MSGTVSSKKRLSLTLLGIAVVFFLLICRLFVIQVIQGEKLQERALSQWTTDTSLSAKRGKIVDANGIVLAQSGTAYKILLWPQAIATKAGERERIARELANVLEMDEAYVFSKVCDTTKQEIVLKRQVEKSVVEEIASLKLGSGVVAAIDTKRYYPSGSLFSQLLGFTTVDGEGQSGLELALNKYLSGKNGRMITETDRKGRTLAYGVQEYVKPTDGCDVELTTDSVIQSFLEKALKEALEVNKAQRAQGIIMDAQTGAIVALSTQPDYDPNQPPRSDLELLASVSRNRIAADAYEPGSTFKIITLASAIDSNAVNDTTTYDCPGYYVVNGQRIKCWKAGGHKHETLTQAAENSCNTAFMQMALAMGVDEFYDYIYKFGFGSSTGSGLTGESGGIVTHQKYVRDTDLARIGFGQSIAVTPLQLTSAVCAAVNGGKLMQPYIVKRITSQDGTVISQTEPTVVRNVISEESSKKVRTILESVVANGSGKNAQINGYRVGGKTGTAQKYDSDGGIAQGKLIASFIGFAPADNPRYVCLILVDEPQVGTIFGSTVAAPFVKTVLEETLQYSGYLPEKSVDPVEVPNLIGLTTAEAKLEARKYGLGIVCQEEDAVIAQIPAAGERVLPGMEILLYTEATTVEAEDAVRDDDYVTMPDLMDYTRLQAHDKLKKLGLVLIVDEAYSAGTAFDQSVKAGELVKSGSEVTVKFHLTED